jgi:hypothetical protein
MRPKPLIPTLVAIVYPPQFFISLHPDKSG